MSGLSKNSSRYAVCSSFITFSVLPLFLLLNWIRNLYLLARPLITSVFFRGLFGNSFSTLLTLLWSDCFVVNAAAHWVEDEVALEPLLLFCCCDCCSCCFFLSRYSFFLILSFSRCSLYFIGSKYFNVWSFIFFLSLSDFLYFSLFFSRYFFKYSLFASLFDLFNLGLPISNNFPKLSISFNKAMTECF